MGKNDALVADVIEAERERGKKPCLWCKKLTKNQDELHARCRKAYHEQQQLIQQRLERRERYTEIMGRIDMGKLNETERTFIEESVQNRIINGTDLTPRQNNWLMRLTAKYPSGKQVERRRVATVRALEYEWL
jgi:hypothetical protein